MGPFKTCIIQERGEGWLTKNVTKSDVGGGVAYGNDPYAADLCCCIFVSGFVDDAISFL